MLTWIDSRWHCDGEPIHAGSMWQLKCPDGWLTVRIESGDQGRILVAYADVMGREFGSRISDRDQLRPAD